MLSKHFQKGASLLEVLVSVLIFSTALLALAALHTRALQFNHSAYVRSQVNILSAELFDRIRINRDGYSHYNLALTAVSPDPDPADPDEGASGQSGSAPTGLAAVAAADIEEWLARVASIVPDAQARITCAASAVCEIEVLWDYQIGTGELAEADKANRLIYSTRI